MSGFVVEKSQSELTEIILALCSTGSFASRLDGGE
jgi:hypothetical protein